jgi:hypothetical protein
MVVLRRRRSMCTGSSCTMRSASSDAAALAGVIAAENMYGAEPCWM